MAAAFYADGKTMVSAGLDGAVKVWNPITERTEKNRIALTNVIGSALCPDATSFVAWERDGSCRIWDVATFAEVAHFTLEVTNVTEVAISSRRTSLAVASAPGGVNVLEIAARRTIAHLSADFVVADLHFSPDGNWLAGGGADERVAVWNLLSREKVFYASRTILSGGAPFRGALAFAPDNRLLATGGKDGQITLWSIPDGRPILKIAAHQNRVLGIGFSQDGRLLASGGYDGTIKLWDVKTGQQTNRLLGQLLPARSFGFSRDGRRLAAGFNDGTVKLWDLATQRELVTLPGSDQVVRATAFLDENTLVSLEPLSLVVWRAATKGDIDVINVAP